MAKTLSLTDITKDFGGGPVLAGISLDIEPVSYTHLTLPTKA